MLKKKRLLPKLVLLIFALSCLLSGIQSLAVTPDVWTLKAQIPSGRTTGLAVMNSNGCVYVVGGGTTAFERYFVTSNSWESRANLNAARNNPGVAFGNGSFHVFGGMVSNSPTNTVEKHNFSTNSWSYVANMPTARASMGVVAVDGKIYCIGGEGAGSALLSTVECYDPATDTWTTKASMPTARTGLTVAAVKGKIYAVGGRITGGNCTNVVECYDPATNTWTTKASANSYRTDAAAAVIQNKIYVAGGKNKISAYQRTLEAYDVNTNSWEFLPDIQYQRTDLALVSVYGKLYAFGGASSAGENTTYPEEFFPSTSLKGYWNFGEALKDNSGYDNNINYTESIAVYHDGPFGSYIYKSGNSYLTVPNSSSLNFGTGDFSIACWFKTTETKTYNTIIDKRDATKGYLFLLYNGKPLVQIADGAGYANYYPSTSTTYNDGQWHFFAATADRDSSLKFYMDGTTPIYTANPSARSGDTSNTTNLLITGHRDNMDAYFRGYLDEIRLFNRVLTTSEINDLRTYSVP